MDKNIDWLGAARKTAKTYGQISATSAFRLLDLIAELKAENETTALQHIVIANNEVKEKYYLEEIDKLKEQVAELKLEIKGMGHVNNVEGRWVCKFIRYKKVDNK